MMKRITAKEIRELLRIDNNVYFNDMYEGKDMIYIAKPSQYNSSPCETKELFTIVDQLDKLKEHIKYKIHMHEIIINLKYEEMK